ncbi:hypothetical protein STEG23_010791 [Scotinomys teguina]
MLALLFSFKAVGFVSEDEYLEIQGITREQSGDYECSASNDVAAPVVRRVKVTVNYPPYISEAKGTGVPVGQKGTLQCEASAVPSAEFQWFKDDKRLIEGKKGVKVENRPFLSKLIFFNVSEHDYGNYTCVASNKLGHTNASIMLFELNEPTSSTLLQEVKTTALTPWKGLYIYFSGICCLSGNGLNVKGGNEGEQEHPSVVGELTFVLHLSVPSYLLGHDMSLELSAKARDKAKNTQERGEEKRVD